MSMSKTMAKVIFRVISRVTLLTFSFMLLGKFALAQSKADSGWFAAAGPKKTTLVELYTSQGCSSCPPAETYLNRIDKKYVLWRDVVPIAFHVDYWDYIGWKDKYATKENSNRQRRHQQFDNLSRVYTPGFVVDGQEWYSFFRGENLRLSQDQAAPTLQVKFSKGNKLIVKVGGLKKNQVIINVGILASGIKDYIRSGENADRTLLQNFVLIGHKEYKKQGGNFWTLDFPSYEKKIGDKKALVVWLTDDEYHVIQATGNYLSPAQDRKINS